MGFDVGLHVSFRVVGLDVGLRVVGSVVVGVLVVGSLVVGSLVEGWLVDGSLVVGWLVVGSYVVGSFVGLRDGLNVGLLVVGLEVVVCLRFWIVMGGGKGKSRLTRVCSNLNHDIMPLIGWKSWLPPVLSLSCKSSYV